MNTPANSVILRKRDRTREKLLVAAQELVLERGLPAITINDIAARAQMAPGTFYNYFRTREEVADTIAQLLEQAYHRDVDAITRDMDDAVRIFSASLRQTLHWVQPQGTLGKLMFASGVPLMRYAAGIRLRATRDIQHGMNSGAFRVDDVATVQSMLAGIVVGVSVDLWMGLLPPTAIPEVTERSLVLLGVSAAKAARIVREPLALQPAPAVPLAASDWLDPVERERGPTAPAERPVGGIMLAMPEMSAGPGKRPRASRPRTPG